MDDAALPFRVVVRSADEGLTLEVHGELDASIAPDLSDLLAAAIACSEGPVTIDLAGVTFIDSAVLATLVAAHGSSSVRGDSLCLRQPRARTGGVPRVSGADRELPLAGPVSG